MLFEQLAMRGSPLPTLLLYAHLLVHPFLGAAWFDSGHMTVAAIARQYADPEKVAALDVLLNTSSLSHGHVLGNIVTAAAWMDKIKCRPDQVKAKFLGCKGITKPPHNNLLDKMHFIKWPYNKDGWDPAPASLPDGLADDGALWALRSASVVLSPGSGVSEPSSWDMSVRTMVHLFADLHQPLHLGDLYYDGVFDQGTLGGLRIKIKAEHVSPMLPMLHMLWDAAGGNGKAGGDAPWWLNHPPKNDAADKGIVDADIEAVVRYVTKKYPPDSFIPDRLDPGWNSAEAGCGISKLRSLNEFTPRLYTFVEDIALDTRKLVRFAYEEYVALLQGSDPHGKTPDYAPSAKYIQEVQEMSLKQIALAGYRLASVLCHVNTDEIPKPGSDFGIPSANEGNDAQETEEANKVALLVVGVVALLIGLVAGAGLHAVLAKRVWNVNAPEREAQVQMVSLSAQRV